MATEEVRAVWAALAGMFLSWAAIASASIAAEREKAVFRAGAAEVDISPTQFPVIVSGGFLQQQASRLHDPLHARCLVLDDGSTRIAVAVVDTLFMPRELLEEIKREASRATGIPVERMLISATHTHSAPSVVACLGTGVEESYVPVLRQGVVRAIEAAARSLTPARIGWAVIADPEHTNCRRWIRRPDRVGTDPFGQKTIRAMMHPGYMNPDYEGPAGPEDPDLSVLAVQSLDGRPIAVLANYSMHYFGAAPVSADYFGRFCARFARLVGAEKLERPFVAMMSQGTAGDLHWMDYGRPARTINIEAYAQQVAEVAWKAYQTIGYRDWVPLKMAEKRLLLARRVPDAGRLAWAEQIIQKMKPRSLPASITEVYALEQLYLAKEPQRELTLQAIRIGELGIAGFPNEVFGITGLKVKAQSPLCPTFNIELANGQEGYIPPPEQHELGGYTTWPARTAGLEVEAEPKIVEAVLQLLEQVSGRPRRPFAEVHGPYAQAVLDSKPLAYWRLGEWAGRQAADSSGHNHSARLEPGFALYLEGPEAQGFCGANHVNRAVHFAGGRMTCTLPSLHPAYSVELWFYNCLPADARPVTGYLFCCGSEKADENQREHLAISGAGRHAGKLLFLSLIHI